MDIFFVGKTANQRRKAELEAEVDWLRASQRLYGALRPNEVTKKEVAHHERLASKGNAMQRQESKDFLQRVKDGARLEEIRGELELLKSKSLGEELMGDAEGAEED